jgi:hypothetical protein
VRAIAVLAATCSLAVLSGCGSGDQAAKPTDERSTQPTSAMPGAALPQSDESVELDPADFTARVVRDTVTLDGEIIEDTLDWYAQYADGTVWYLGEDTAELEDGTITTREGSFEAGVDGAQAGVIMPASPEVGMAYRQEYYEGEAEDNGEVLALGEQATVPAGRYDGLLKTADTTPLEPDVLEHKYYARDVGVVLTVDKETGGREELMSVTQIPPGRARRAGYAALGQGY